MIMLGEDKERLYRNYLHDSCNFYVSLKFLQNQKFKNNCSEILWEKSPQERYQEQSVVHHIGHTVSISV